MMRNMQIQYTNLHLALGERLLELFGLHYQYSLANRRYEIYNAQDKKVGNTNILLQDEVKLDFQMPYGTVKSQIDFHGHEDEKTVFSVPFQLEGIKNIYIGKYFIPLYFQEEAKGISLKIKTKEGEMLKSLEINNKNNSLILKDYENDCECQIINIENHRRKILFEGLEKGEQKMIVDRSGSLKYYEEDVLKESFPKTVLSKDEKYALQKAYIEEKMPHFYEEIALFESTLVDDGVTLFPRIIAFCYENYKDTKTVLCTGKSKIKLIEKEQKNYFPKYPGHVIFKPQKIKRSFKF